MNLHRNMTLDEFRDEMQHLVMTQKLNSKPVKEALRFARQQKDPAFLRIAANKLEAQKQFLHEEFGPSTWQKAWDFLQGAPKEMAQTVLVVAVVLLTVKSLGWFGNPPSTDSRVEFNVDRITQQMEDYFSQHDDLTGIRTRWDQLDGEVQKQITSGIKDADIQHTVETQLTESLSSDNVSTLINNAVVKNVVDANVAQTVAEQVTGAVDTKTLKKVIHDEVTSAIRETGIGDIVQIAMLKQLQGEEFKTMIHQQIEQSLGQQKIGEQVAAEISTQIRTAGIRDQILSDVSTALKDSDPDGKINALIAARLKQLDSELKQRSQDLQQQITTSFEKALDTDKLQQRVNTEVDRGIKRVQVQTSQSEAALHQQTRSLLKLLDSGTPTSHPVPTPSVDDPSSKQQKVNQPDDSKTPVALAAESE